ncbi:hypothetical protein ATCC90586_006457 [Pythium insidiosum]|nr:hypothetical protein ATCC90586_006457 [Pythium insidiosum]
MRVLVAHGALASQAPGQDEFEDRLLCIAVRGNAEELLLALVLENDVQSRWPHKLYMYACDAQDESMLGALLRCRVDPLARGLEGWTALHVAATQGGPRHVQLLLEQGAITLKSSASAAGPFEMQSLHDEFIRKGIVVADGDARDTAASLALDPRVIKLLDGLKRSCTGSAQDVHEITSVLQLWRERSLHHTLQTLDLVAASDANRLSAGRERHIEAIELHEKAGRELKDGVLRVVQQLLATIQQHIEAFTRQLSTLLRELIKPELQHELEKERRIVERLLDDKRRVERDRAALEQANVQLAERVDALENAPDGSGDAILCRKLREQLRELREAQREMTHKLEEMTQEQARARYETAQMQREMERLQKTLVMTRAMHDKETKQLVELVQLRQTQFREVAQAVAASGVNARHASGENIVLQTYDPYSGTQIAFKKSPPKPMPSPPRRSSGAGSSPSPTRLARKTLVTLSKSPPWLQPSPPSPSDRRSLSEAGDSNNSPSAPSAAGSPTGRVLRPFVEDTS